MNKTEGERGRPRNTLLRKNDSAGAEEATRMDALRNGNATENDPDGTSHDDDTLEDIVRH